MQELCVGLASVPCSVQGQAGWACPPQAVALEASFSVSLSWDFPVTGLEQ